MTLRYSFAAHVGKRSCIGSYQHCQIDIQLIKCPCEVPLLLLAGGHPLRTRSNGYDQLGASIRFYDKNGLKLVDWEAHRFANEPERARAAFLHILLKPALLKNYRRTDQNDFIIPAKTHAESKEQVFYTLDGNYDLRSMWRSP